MSHRLKCFKIIIMDKFESAYKNLVKEMGFDEKPHGFWKRNMFKFEGHSFQLRADGEGLAFAEGRYSRVSNGAVLIVVENLLTGQWKFLKTNPQTREPMLLKSYDFDCKRESIINQYENAN